jgi:Kdo2-lipid IVA lauroyltransferase/acyltransferase
MRPLKRFRHAALYWLVRVVWLLFNHIPRRTAIWLGGSIGALAWRLIKRDQEIVVKNLTLVYGDSMPMATKLAIGKGFFVNSGKNVADIVRLKRKFHSEILPQVECEGIEHLDAAYQRGKGVIAVTGHIGNFELLAAFVASRGYKTAVIGRELHDQRLNNLLVSNRTAMNLANVSTTDPPIRLMRLLRDGYVIGVLIDIDSHRIRNAQIPFFGHLANTPVGQTMLGLRSGAAFVPGFCVRRSENSYQAFFHEEIKSQLSSDSEEAVIDITARCSKALEGAIDQYRDQWIWLHRRWSKQLNYPA